MKYSILSISLVGVLLSAGGCYQSAAVRNEAVNLDKEVQDFKAQKQTQIQTMNQTFQDTSEKLMDQLTALCDAQLDLSRDLDSQAIADQAVIDPNWVLLPGLMHDHSVNFINDQWGKIQTVEKQINDARTTYATSYKQLQVTLSQLDSIHTSLEKLIDDSNSPDAQTILGYLQGAYDGAKTGIANAKTDLQKTGSGTSTPAPAAHS
jgi:hypothetical protein